MLLAALLLSVTANDTIYIDVSVERRDEPRSATEARLRDALARRLAPVEVARDCLAGDVMRDVDTWPIVERKMNLQPQVLPPFAELAVDDELRAALAKVCGASMPARERIESIVRGADVTGCDLNESAEGITRITLTRGRGHADEFTVFEGGVVRYEASLPKAITRTGHIALEELRAMAVALDDAGFFCMKERNYRYASDAACYTISALRGATRTSVQNCDDAAPKVLDELYARMTKLLDDVVWDSPREGSIANAPAFIGEGISLPACIHVDTIPHAFQDVPDVLTLTKAGDPRWKGRFQLIERYRNIPGNWTLDDDGALRIAWTTVAYGLGIRIARPGVGAMRGTIGTFSDFSAGTGPWPIELHVERCE